VVGTQDRGELPDATRGEAPPAWVRRQPADGASGQSGVPPRL